MITLAEAAQATGGEWLAQPLPPETPLQGGAFDTRALDGAGIFFALSGEHSDGHAYLPRLAGSSVRLAVVARPADAGDYGGALLRVADPLAALAAMAHFLVEKYHPTVVAITGSYGKTTAKEVIAHVLAGQQRVLKSPGSLNNEIGVPVTLLGLDGSQDTVVLEYSARKPGDIDYLSRIAPPDVAVLLAVGQAHIGVFGSQEAIFRAKGEIFHHLRPGGTAIVGAAQPRLREMAAPHRVLSFGAEAGDFHAEDIAFDAEGHQCFTAVRGSGPDAVRLPLRAGMPGPHGCEPVLAAWAVAHTLGLSDRLVTERGGVAPGQKGRLRVVPAQGGATLIDDCYNASPETVANLIGTLNARPEGDKVLVLGPLAELEEGLRDSARAIAERLRPPLARCLVYDPRGSLLAEHLQAGAQGVDVVHVASQPALMAALRELDAPGRIIGIKGARSAHMERFILALQGVPVGCQRHPCSLLKYCTDCELLGGT
ncbi:MAG TPA: UDP-N-acetylmuramoyl-tripeptide--D-alanyl-D-alanine ligase [bacterium]|nr:UDP-N-acetylmuramoyl-tripeptide--D-alanyl-D-alanine ligase [bacterium]